MTSAQVYPNAAWFAEAEGSGGLLWSDIGSEGRNFQFAHHLVMWDLPLDPDLLEQRIGRLDRIGQRHDITIHAAAFDGTAQHALLRWYRMGVDVGAKLPLLATYLGHGSAVSTHHYLHFIEPLRTAASKRFADHYGRLITPLLHSKGRR